MLKIAVVGANGKSGRLIVTEALRRGYDVTAVVRHANESGAGSVIENGKSRSQSWYNDGREKASG